MTMTGEIQGTKKEFIKIFNEMCYSRSGWQVWSDLISTMACSIANAVDRSEPRFSNREKEYAHCIERLGGVDNPAFLSAPYQHREDAENHRISIQA